MPPSKRNNTIDSETFIETVRDNLNRANEYLEKGIRLIDPYRAYRNALELELYEVAAAVIRSGLNPQYYKHGLHDSLFSEIELYYYLDGYQEMDNPDVNWSRILIQAGAFTNPLNEKGQTPLDIATSKYRHPLAVPLLKAAGAKHAYELTLEDKLLETNFYVLCQLVDFPTLQKCIQLRKEKELRLFPLEQEYAVAHALVFSPEASVPPFGHLKLLDLVIDSYKTDINTSCILSFLITNRHRKNPETSLIAQHVLQHLRDRKCNFNSIYYDHTTLDNAIILDSDIIIKMIREWGGKTMEELKAEGRVRLIDPPPDCFGSPINTWELIPDNDR
jgi:hypothetical protein